MCVTKDERKLIYADNAATTRMSEAAKAAMLECIDECFGNPSAMHPDGQKAAMELMRSRRIMAEHLNCLQNEIYFTSGGSESDNQALISAAAAGDAKGCRHIISVETEHHAVLNTLKKLEKQGFEVALLRPDEEGLVSPQQVEAAIREDTALVSVMYANNEIGTIAPVADIGRICRERGVVFHTDAVQAAGNIAIDVKAQEIDMLSLSAHKFHGPKGIGLLYARRGTELVSLIEGGAQERGRRAGTENHPAIAGMAAAFREACINRQENTIKTAQLRDYIISRLSEIPGAVLNGPAPQKLRSDCQGAFDKDAPSSADKAGSGGSRSGVSRPAGAEEKNSCISHSKLSSHGSPDAALRLPGNVSFCFEGVNSESLLLQLSQHGICASAGSACMSGSIEPSHVMLAIGRSRELASGSLRLTFSAENTMEEAELICSVMPGIISKLRGE